MMKINENVVQVWAYTGMKKLNESYKTPFDNTTF